MSETLLTVVGNLVSDPEVRQTSAGLSVANVTIASTPRSFNKQTNEWVDGETLFLRGSIWREAADNAAATLTKGMRVIVQGNLKQRSYTDKDGNQRTSYELDILEIGPSLRYATAQVTRNQPRNPAGTPAQSMPQQGYAQPQQGYGPPAGVQAPAQGYAPAQGAPAPSAMPQPGQAQQWATPQQGWDQSPF